MNLEAASILDKKLIVGQKIFNMKTQEYAVVTEIDYEGTYICDVFDMDDKEKIEYAKNIAQGKSQLVNILRPTFDMVKEILGEEAGQVYLAEKEVNKIERKKRSASAKQGWTKRRRNKEVKETIKWSKFISNH